MPTPTGDNGRRRFIRVLIGFALTRGDILGCLRCVVAFAALLFAPGYCLAFASNLLGFRVRPTAERIPWAVALSFGLATITAVELAHLVSLTAVCWSAAAFAVVCMGIVAWQISERTRGFSKRWALIATGIAAAWTLFAILELADFGIGPHLYLSVTIFDHALRAAFVDSVLRTGVPPANPLFFPGHAASMRYYYFWYVLTAAAARLAGATARQAMIASVVWAGFGLAAILALYSRHFLGGRTTQTTRKLRPRLAIALALLPVTGLDILPAIAKFILRLPTDADMEWWSPDQVSSWLDSLLWVPHHIAGLVCCLFGFLLVWMSKGLSKPQRLACALISGVCFASAFGLSTWVAVAFALVLVLWMVWVFVWEPALRPRLPVLLGAGPIAVLALSPYLRELRQEASAASSIAANATGLLHFGVRHMIDPDGLLALPGFASLARSYPRLEDAIAGLVLILPGYSIELGFFGLTFIAAVRAARRFALDEATRTSLALVAAGLLFASLLRSSVVVNNDFGIRSILISQFFLLLVALVWLEGGFGPTARWLRTTALALAAIGVAGTIYQSVGLRLYLPVEDRLGRPEERGLAERAMALRVAFDAADSVIPASAVVQFDPTQPSDYFRYAEILEARHQIATAAPGCDAAFGGDASACPALEQAVADIFSDARGTDAAGPLGPRRTASAVQQTCARFGITHLVATRWDAVWADRSGWVWALPAAIETDDVRILKCTAANR